MEVWKEEDRARLDSNEAKRKAYRAAKAKWEEDKKRWAVDKKNGVVDGRFPQAAPKLGKLPGPKPKPGKVVDDAGPLSSSTEGGTVGGEDESGSDDYF
jgi:hypothetical protein